VGVPHQRYVTVAPRVAPAAAARTGTRNIQTVFFSFDCFLLVE
jgi:hypothetical protein